MSLIKDQYENEKYQRIEAESKLENESWLNDHAKMVNANTVE